MINRLLKSSLLVLALAIAFCPSSLPAASLGKYLASIEKDQAPVAGKEYYVRHTFMHEKGIHVATNYWRGMLTPINSKVSLISLDDKSMLLKLSSGETVKVENMPKFTRLDMKAVAKRMLASAPVPIEGFGKTTVTAIQNGVLKAGMTKDQVLMARGFPPSHETPSLDLDTWKYWSNRFVTQSIVFQNGVLVRGRGIE